MKFRNLQKYSTSSDGNPVCTANCKHDQKNDAGRPLNADVFTVKAKLVKYNIHTSNGTCASKPVDREKRKARPDAGHMTYVPRVGV